MIPSTAAADVSVVTPSTGLTSGAETDGLTAVSDNAWCPPGSGSVAFQRHSKKHDEHLEWAKGVLGDLQAYTQGGLVPRKVKQNGKNRYINDECLKLEDFCVDDSDEDTLRKLKTVHLAVEYLKSTCVTYLDQWMEWLLVDTANSRELAAFTTGSATKEFKTGNEVRNAIEHDSNLEGPTFLFLARFNAGPSTRQRRELRKLEDRWLSRLGKLKYHQPYGYSSGRPAISAFQKRASERKRNVFNSMNSKAYCLTGKRVKKTSKADSCDSGWMDEVNLYADMKLQNDIHAEHDVRLQHVKNAQKRGQSVHVTLDHLKEVVAKKRRTENAHR